MTTVEHIQVFGEAAVSIFAIVNPIGGLPVFVSLMEDTPLHEQRRLFRLAGLTALVIIGVMALAGQFLMHTVFQVGMEEFAFGGGLLLVVIGIRSLLEGPESRQAALNDADRRQMQTRLAISPIASPLLVGPGAIVNVMLIVNQHGRLFALGACLAAFVFVILVLNYAHLIYRVMGRLGSLAIGRVMEIFIVAIGVKFCFEAIAKVFPALLGR